MAKPIKATPTIRGKYAKMFVEEMSRTEHRKPTKQEQILIDAMLANC